MASGVVDAMWAQMQQDHQGKRRVEAPCTAGKPFDLSSLQFERKRSNNNAKQIDASLSWMQSWSASLKPHTRLGSTPHLKMAAEGADEMTLVEPPSTLMDATSELPMETPETFLAYLQRDINCLAEERALVRLQSLQKLEKVLVGRADELPTDIIDAVADTLLKPLLKRLKDKSEKCRELSVKILTSLVECSSDLVSMLPYIFATLVSRLGSEDLDGVAHLPEVARPDPEQKPTQIARPVEESEEVRLQMARLVSALLRRCNQTQIYNYIDEATGLVRAQAMDPYHEVKAVACETMTSFCYNNHEMLLHFTEPLGRSLTSVLTHNHGKLRIAALRALTAVLHCGTWKHNHEVIQMLMAWQDPNKCPIKAFYEPVTSVNYMANLSFDRHPAVRRFWYETLAHWLLCLPDKCDHEPYIFPYFLTGLCDDNEEIALECFWLIERCGALYEVDKEDELRKTRQYGFDYGWTHSGRAFVPFPLQAIWAGGGKGASVRRCPATGPDMMGERELVDHQRRDADEMGTDYGEEIELPDRDYAWPDLRDLRVYRNLPRPRLGARMWVRTNTRRYIKATFNDVVDFRDCTALNAGRLLCMSVAYTEEGVTEWLQPMLAAICKFFAGRAAASGDTQCMQTYGCVCKLVGSFCEPLAYWTQLKDALHPDSALHVDQRVASVRILALCLEGTVEALDSISVHDRPSVGLGRLEDILPEVIVSMHASDLLLWPSMTSRKTMWDLLFSFLGSLQEYLTFEQVAQLLYVSLALAAKPPPEAVTERASQSECIDIPTFEDEEIVDGANLQKALELLSIRATVLRPATKAVAISLNEMDDGPIVEASLEGSTTLDPRAVHQELFQHAFSEVLAGLDESFQIFRTIVYLTPLSVLASLKHSQEVLKRFGYYLGTSSQASIRCDAQALGFHLAFRCSRSIARLDCNALVEQIQTLMRTLFQLFGKALVDACANANTLSFVVIMSGLSLCRQFAVHPEGSPRDLFFPFLGQPSRPMQWLTSLFTDQELYKKFHAMLESNEKTMTGKSSRADFVVKTARQIREGSEKRSEIVRTLAASTLLVGLRRLQIDGQGRPIPWADGKQPGSLRNLFLAVASLFRPAMPTIEPLFMKPTQPRLVIYAAEILRILLHVHAGRHPSPFKLVDDAARAIHNVSIDLTLLPSLPFKLTPEEMETLVLETISALLDLNLTLPPDPDTKHAPVTLDAASADVGDEILLGWDEILSDVASPAQAAYLSKPRDREQKGMMEVRRLLAQSVECLRWNAALVLYRLGVDLSLVCEDAFKRNLEKWSKRREQAKVLVIVDILGRASRSARNKSNGLPRNIAPCDAKVLGACA